MSSTANPSLYPWRYPADKKFTGFIALDCGIFLFPPEDPEVLSKVDRRAAFGAMQAAEMLVPDEDALHPYMHATPTLDFGCIMSGP